MTIWHEYQLSISGITVIAAVRWYRTDDPSEEPFHTDTFRFSLTDPATSPSRVYQEFRDRREQIIRALELFDQLTAAFGSNQNTRRTL